MKIIPSNKNLEKSNTITLVEAIPIFATFFEKFGSFK